MNLNNFKKKLKSKIWRNIKNHFYDERIEDSALVQNINLTTTRNQKKAVISYVTYSYFKDWKNHNIGRTQPFEILSMVKVLSEMDYAIDIVGHDDLQALEYLKLKKYDLIIGFGEAFYQLTLVHPNAISVLYMTEHHPDIAKIEEQKRIDYFYERHKKKVNTVRTGIYYKDHHLKKHYSHIITMSEVEPYINEYPDTFAFFPSGIQNDNFKFELKNHDISKKHFLWFGSYGAIHKGLDLLFDVFKKRDDIVLHVAGFYESDRQQLDFPKRNNIIDYGYVNIQSERFLKLMQTCSFSILPSCAEGCSTAITTTMRHGLIPIVMKDTGFNRLHKHAIFLHDVNINDINKQLTDISNKKSNYLTTFSENAYAFAQENFSIQAFENKFASIMKEIHNSDNND